MKRGMILLKEVVYVMLAVIAVLVLGGLFSKVWSIMTPSTEKEQANNMLAQTASILESVPAGQETDLYVYVPDEYFMTFSNNQAPEAGITFPSECLGENCICICDEKCEKIVFCRKISKPLLNKGAVFKKKIPFTLMITNNANDFSTSEAIEDVVNEGKVNVISETCYGDLVSLTKDKCTVETDGQDKCVRQSVKPIFDKATEIAQAQGITLSVKSAYRTEQMQQSLWISKGKDSKYVCEPSPNCPHETGCALDVCFGKLCTSGLSPHLDDADTKLLESIMVQAGFARYKNEYWHFEYGTTRWETCRKTGETAC